MIDVSVNFRPRHIRRPFHTPHEGGKDVEPRKFFEEELPNRDVSDKTAGMTASYKFDIQDAGTWLVEVNDGSLEVKEEDGDAQCTVIVGADDFDQITDGKLNPQMAFMSGKLKIQGDMGLAMKLGQVL